MKSKEYAEDVVRRMTDEEYDAHDLSTLIFMLHSGIYIVGDTVYTVYQDEPEISVERFKRKYSLTGTNSKIVAYFNKVSKHFHKLVEELLKDDEVQMNLAMKVVVYLREHDFKYTGTYKKAREIIDKFDIFDNCDSAMIELANLAYQYRAIAPEEFLNDIADFVDRYFKGYYQ